MSQTQDLANKYQIKSEIQHILDRPGTWVGSITNDLITAPIYYPSQNKLKIVDNIPFNQALHKLVDEVFSVGELFLYFNLMTFKK